MQGIYIEKITELSFCEGCLAGKMCRKPFPTVGEIRSTNYSCCIYSDVCGPMQTRSIGGAKYFIAFIDDYTRCCAVHLASLNTNQKCVTNLKKYEVTTTNFAGRAIGTLRMDNGGKYLLSEFQNYLKEKGMRYELTVPHSPSTEGCISDRLNRTLVESARSMIRRTFFGPKLSLKLRM